MDRNRRWSGKRRKKEDGREVVEGRRRGAGRKKGWEDEEKERGEGREEDRGRRGGRDEKRMGREKE